MNDLNLVKVKLMETNDRLQKIHQIDRLKSETAQPNITLQFQSLNALQLLAALIRG